MSTAQEIDAITFRRILGQFATGVAVVSALDMNGKPYGLTVNSFTSLSLEPPLIQWSLRRAAYSFPIFTQADHFAVSVLAEDQEHVSRRFCASTDRFAEGYVRGLHGLPLVADALAWIECVRETQFSAGDHVILVGRVLRAKHWSKLPLLHWQGAYCRLACATGREGIGGTQG